MFFTWSSIVSGLTDAILISLSHCARAVLSSFQSCMSPENDHRLNCDKMPQLDIVVCKGLRTNSVVVKTTLTETKTRPRPECAKTESRPRP